MVVFALEEVEAIVIPCVYYKINNIMPIIGLTETESFARGRKNIYRGYHSYKDEINAESIIHTAFDDGKIRKFIIPKGTKYYANENEYVSETIMLVE